MNKKSFNASLNIENGNFMEKILMMKENMQSYSGE